MRPERRDRGGTLLILTDITELVSVQQELESARSSLETRVRDRTRDLEQANAELREATRARDRFMANVSHEIRTPLSSIIAFAEVLLSGSAGELTPAQRERIEVVVTSGKHQRAVIDDLLDLARLRLGRAPVDAEEFSLGELLRFVEQITRPLAEEKGLALRVETHVEQLVLETDQEKLRQILLNLLANAVKFTHSGEVCLSATSDHDHRVLFQVSDTGTGIPPDHHPSIMDEFVQVERTDGMSPDGVGLGLAISRRLASLLGGELRVESDLGQGSRFTLEVPVSYGPGRIQ
jgi:signal transduction histidine kinase